MGLLNHGLLAAALSRARRGHLDRDTPLAHAAAFLLRGIGRDHPFVDGNKRTAWEATDMFLSRHGWFLKAEPEEAEAFMLAVAGRDHSLGFSAIVEWIETHMEKLFDQGGGHSR